MWGFPAEHPLGALVDIAGWVEFISAFLIGLGIFTRLGAGALCVTMVVAYFRVHANNGIWPHIFPEGGYGANGGEVAILWFVIAGISRGPGQPQVRHRADGVQEGDFLEVEQLYSGKRP